MNETNESLSGYFASIAAIKSRLASLEQNAGDFGFGPEFLQLLAAAMVAISLVEENSPQNPPEAKQALERIGNALILVLYGLSRSGFENISDEILEHKKTAAKQIPRVFSDMTTGSNHATRLGSVEEDREPRGGQRRAW